MITVRLKDNETFARSAQIHMPGYALPPTGSFALELRRDAGAPLALGFSSGAGSLRVIGVDAATEKIIIALLASARDVATLSGVYQGDLLYIDGAESSNLARFLFDVEPGVTQAALVAPTDYSALAVFEPLRDIAQEDAASVLQFMQRGATGPAPWGALAPWEPGVTYSVGPPASLVAFGGGAFICAATHVSGATFDFSKWTRLVDPDWGFPTNHSLDLGANGASLMSF